jgi:TfoX/Sxy family transcriptional regulator of competence genes
LEIDMASELLDNLQETLTEATRSLPKVTDKKMFGCHALWANHNVFALVWKHGRIGLKLPDEATYESLMSMKGAEPWKAGPMKMSHWVLVPESFHGKSAELRKWAALAHKQCSVLEKKPAKATAAKKATLPKGTKKKVK